MGSGGRETAPLSRHFGRLRSHHTRRHTVIRSGVAASAALLALSGLAACQRGSNAAGTHASSSAHASSAAPVPPVQLAITPSDGTTAVAASDAVKVTATNGTLSHVSVDDGQGDVAVGAVDPTGHTWTSDAGLVPDSTYVVTATGLDAAGKATTTTSSFTTAKPTKVLGMKIAPLEGETVGVGMPIVVYFTAPVTDKAAVERQLTVQESAPVEGAWHWYGSEEVHYRPAQYWPAGERVTLTANLRGVDAGKGTFGMENRTLHFAVGDSHVTTVNAKTDEMKVVVNGQLVKTVPVSLGRDKYPTTSGVHVVLEKTPSIIMDSATVGIPKGNPDYYYETVLWDVRISWSGEFVHAAPWSVNAQGHDNVSHGCVNASTADAQWFYNLSRRGDIVEITGTPRPLQSGNGWTDWNMGWSQWLAGSALTAAPSAAGSTSSGPSSSAPTH